MSSVKVQLGVSGLAADSSLQKTSTHKHKSHGSRLTLTDVDPEDDAMYTLITMIKSLMLTRVTVSSGRSVGRPAPGEEQQQQQQQQTSPVEMSAEGSADYLRKCALSSAVAEVCILPPPLLRLPAPSSSPSLSLSLCRTRERAHTHTRRHVHAQTDRLAGPLERQDNRV